MVQAHTAGGSKESPTNLAARIRLVGLAGALLVFAWLSASSLGRVHSYLWFDTREYLASSTAPVFSEAFLLGRRAPLIPLVLKWLHRDLERLYTVQVLFSIAAWSFLLVVLLPSVRKGAARAVLVVAVLALGLSSQVALWHYAPLSESISNSLSLVLIGCGVLLMRAWRWWRCLAVLFVAALWVATRDANAFELIVATVPIGIAVLWGKARRGVLLVCIGFMAYFLVAAYAADRGRNWIHATWNILVHRILPSDEATRYFVAQGMPMTPLLKQQQGRSVTDSIFYEEPALQPFMQWWRKNGRRTYATFLATHPRWALRPLLTESRQMYSEKMLVYESEGFHTRWREVLSKVAYPEGRALFVLLLLAFASTVLAFRERGSLPPDILVPAALVLLGLLMGFINYHCDAREIGRHATHTNLHLRLGLWLLLIQSLTALLAARLAPR